MGRRGPKPTPTAVLKGRGSWRAKDREAEPRPDPTRPTCPRWLSKGAKKLWRDLAPQLHRMGVLTRIDRNVLARYCVTYDQWRRALEVMDEHGPVMGTKDKGGRVISYADRPEVARSMRLADQLNRLEAKLGLSPADRVGLQGDVATMKAIATAASTRGKERFFTEGSAG